MSRAVKIHPGGTKGFDGLQFPLYLLGNKNYILVRDSFFSILQLIIRLNIHRMLASVQR